MTAGLASRPCIPLPLCHAGAWLRACIPAVEGRASLRPCSLRPAGGSCAAWRTAASASSTATSGRRPSVSVTIDPPPTMALAFTTNESATASSWPRQRQLMSHHLADVAHASQLYSMLRGRYLAIHLLKPSGGEGRAGRAVPHMVDAYDRDHVQISLHRSERQRSRRG